VLIVAGTVAALALLADKNRSWWTWKAPLAVGVTVGVTILVGLLVDKWWRPFPDDIPTDVLLWIGVGVLGLALFVARFSTLSWRWRAGALAGAVVLVLLAAAQINR